MMGLENYLLLITAVNIIFFITLLLFTSRLSKDKEVNKELLSVVSNNAAGPLGRSNNESNFKIINVNPIENDTFEDFLLRGQDSLAQKMEVEKSKMNKLISKIPAIVELGLQVSEIKVSKNIMRVGFSQKAIDKLASGALKHGKDKAEKVLAIVVDTNTNKVVEQARELPSTLFTAVNWVSVGMNIVHLVAGWDNARMLKNIDIKLDAILSDRRFEKVARLAAIYETIRESFEYAPKLRTEQLLHLKMELKYLRSVWLNKINSELDEIKSPEEAKEFIIFKDKMRKNGLNKILATDEFLCLTLMTMSLDRLIAYGTETNGIYKKITLPTARNQLQIVASKAIKLRSKLTQKDSEDIKLLVESEKKYVEVIKSLTPSLKNDEETKLSDELERNNDVSVNNLTSSISEKKAA